MQWRVKVGVWNVTCYSTTTTMKTTSQFETDFETERKFGFIHFLRKQLRFLRGYTANTQMSVGITHFL